LEKELNKESEDNRILKRRINTDKKEEEEAEKKIKKVTIKDMVVRWNSNNQGCSKDRAKK
jgi:hypothetical protein